MKHFLSYFCILAILLLFSGCSGDVNITSYEVDLNELDELPVISIQTKNTQKSAINFVTDPVASHVSESIASWTPNYEMPPAPYYEACTVTLTDIDKTVLLTADADVKVRGNWTTSYDKKPLRIKFAEPQNLLGLNDGADFKDWLLLAEYKDASMLRNKTAFTIANELLSEDGLYASDAAFVEVVINEQYWGVYLLAEQQEVNKDRVNVTEAEEGYTGTDIGYFLEFDGYAWTEDPLQKFWIDYADKARLIPYDGNNGSGYTMKCSNEIGMTIKSKIYSEKQRDFIASFVNNVYYIMYAAAYNGEAYVFNKEYTNISLTTDISPREAVERVVDIQSLVDTYILNELLCDADIYWSSFFLSADFGPEGNKKLTFEAPWDFDSAMGLKDRCLDGTEYYAANIVPDVNGNPQDAGNSWLVVLAYEDWYQEMIRETWTAAYDSGVFERACTMIENDVAQYAKAFSRNYDRWNNIIENYAFSSELSWRAAECKTHAEAASFLLEWFESRIEFLNNEWHL